ncbi:MAG: hypothetical protein AAF215_00350 [Cyanobacteria bacterium P01_A01_bin.123]
MNTPNKFLPYLRTGAATVIDTVDNANSPAHFRTTATVAVNGTPVSTPIHLFGPGDVIGLDQNQILRREPAPEEVDFEPNYFPMVELREADLPWRFTPTQADPDGGVRPWLTLITLEVDASLAAQPSGEAPLPAIAAPLAELPNLEEVALWAHVQVSGPFPSTQMSSATLQEYIGDHPDRAIARLLSPRRLKPNTGYLLCLVPTFEVGRLAGLGEDFDEDALGLQPAWNFDPESSGHVKLPVYDLWQFRTGAAGDFESLAAALQPYQYAEEIALQRFTVDPLLAGDDVSLPLEGALRPVVENRVIEPVPNPVPQTLTDWLNRSAEIEEQGGDPQVTPPIYGRWQADRRRVNGADSPDWLDELNLDPRHRIAAAAGGDVVQQYQDEFVQMAWQQTGQLPEANRLLRQAQAASLISTRLQQRHFKSLPADVLLQVAGPSQSRIRPWDSDQTLYKTIESSSVPEAGFEGAFRRMTRSRGPHLRRVLSSTDENSRTFFFQQGYQPYLIRSGQVIDEGNISAPSQWQAHTVGSLKVIKRLTQSSNIYSLPHDPADLPKRGTLYRIGDYRWKDLKFAMLMRTTDNDAMGVMFRYRDSRNFYRFSMDNQRKYRRLVKCVNGRFTLLWQDGFIYQPNQTYAFRVVVEGSRIRLSMGTSRPIQFAEVIDSSIRSGNVALYIWGNHFTEFRDLQLDVNPGYGLHDNLRAQVVDEGNTAAPSKWKVEDGILKQTSNIYSVPKDRNELAKRGTYLKAGQPYWKDYSIEATLATQDDDAIGLMFRYQDTKNFYRFSMDQQRSYQRLVKCVNGKFTLLWQREEGFDTSFFHVGNVVKLIADGTRLIGYLNRSKIFDLRDHSHRQGKIAFYCWGTPDAEFRNVKVRPLHRDRLLNRLNLGLIEGNLPSPLEMETLKQTFLTETNGQKLVNARIRDRIQSAALIDTEPTPLHSAPKIPQPLAPKLIEQAPNLLLPGMQSVPDSAVALVETNPTFVASFLVGANHEMARELLWRGLNSDLRATVFRQFWDVRGGAHRNGTDSQREAHKDIQPIHTWDADEKLADQIGNGTTARCVFLVRSQLIRRFPTANYYLAQAIATGNGRRPGTTTAAPLFRGQLAADMAFFGFDLPISEVRGDAGAGWYFVVEQPPFANRFGLDVDNPDTQLNNWTDLAWNHIQSGPYLHTNDLAIAPPTGNTLPTWGKNAGHMAAITLQKPIRIFIHADRLLADMSVS